MTTYILGLSAFYHDSAACLLRDGHIVAAVQEERFTRKKHDPAFPHSAVEYCLREAAISSSELSYVAFYDKPLLTFERLLETHLATAPVGIRLFWKSMVVWIKKKLWIRYLIQDAIGEDVPILFGQHHESHAASAFYPSPFEEAAIVTLDGVGEWTTTSYGHGSSNEICTLGETKFPHSLGLFYSAFTYFTGFRVNSGEYKLMGLAPYGRPCYVDIILEKIINVKDDGSFRLNTRYFDYISGLTMTSRLMNELFGGPPRKPESPLTQREMDIAASCQKVTEEIMLKIANHAHKETGSKNLCMAGGVALNCVGNGRVLRDGPFDKIWVQPAAGDAGGALGAAMSIWYRYLRNKREVDCGDRMHSSLLGPQYSDSHIERALLEQGAVFTQMDEDEIIDKTAEILADEKVVGWFQDRMEFGPRALGARSILADPRSPKTQSVVNVKIKFRESFRPFAPSILIDHVRNYFELDGESPYMLQVASVKKDRRIIMTDQEKNLFGIEKLNVPRSDVPAITHVDYSARVQTVSHEKNPRYYELIEAFYRITGCPLLVNTSFNVRGEPIVCTPEDAYRCFMRTEMDFLVIGNFLLDKIDQPNWKEYEDWREEFELD
ncbi:MAG: carbamoyltransferase [Candidatus Latescibacterota bacterium]|nr:carbamoyltransferase [Candidatus Latescibacterota bacterium]